MALCLIKYCCEKSLRILSIKILNIKVEVIKNLNLKKTIPIENHIISKKY
jgi:hypothetical protein